MVGSHCESITGGFCQALCIATVGLIIPERAEINQCIQRERERGDKTPYERETLGNSYWKIEMHERKEGESKREMQRMRMPIKNIF